MNRYALGRNVAAFKRWFRFISAAMRRVCAPVHGSFRLKFQRLGLEDQAERNEAVATDVANGSLRKSARTGSLSRWPDSASWGCSVHAPAPPAAFRPAALAAGSACRAR